MASGGREIILAIAPKELLKAFDCGAKSLIDADKLSGVSNDVRHGFAATWFELGKSQKGNVLLTLTFGTGGSLSFELPEGMPDQIYETLAVRLGKSSLPTPDKSSLN